VVIRFPYATYVYSRLPLPPLMWSYDGLTTLDGIINVLTNDELTTFIAPLNY
jgi:hypothetical protein